MLAKTLKSTRGAAIALRYRLGQDSTCPAAERRVTLDIGHFVYSRYFYSFVKFLAIEGVGVDLRFRAETVHALNRAQYGKMVLSERLVALVNAPGGGRLISDSPGAVGFEPFDFHPSRDPRIFDVPMAQHPLMYSRGLWNSPVKPAAAGPSILFVGNSDPGIYGKIDSEGVFNVIGRVRLREILLRDGLGRELSGPGDFGAEREGRVTLVDSSVRPITMERFRQTVADYGFFLCAPGVFMPLCHNLIEAMSVGTIPVIQHSYADLLEPPLEHGKNAIIFEGETDLAEQIEGALKMNPEEIQEMKNGVLEYYDSFLTPRAVVARVMDPGLRGIRMLAGERSVGLLRERRADGNE